MSKNKQTNRLTDILPPFEYSSPTDIIISKDQIMTSTEDTHYNAWVTVKELAEITGTSKQSIFNKIKTHLYGGKGGYEARVLLKQIIVVKVPDK